MCRLAIFNNKAIETLGKDNMKVYLDYLENEQGGMGNGIVFVDNGEITFEHKSVALSNEMIVNLLYKDGAKTPTWFLYHTRIASKGSVSDSNCHPYTNSDKSFSLMMNGTDSTLGVFGKSRDITDTQVIFELLDSTGRDIDCLTELSPRFIGFKEGKVFATNPNGYGGLKYIDTADGELIIASSFPKDVNCSDLKKGYVWIEGQDVEEEIPVVKSFNNYSKTDNLGYSANYYGMYDYNDYDKDWEWNEDGTITYIGDVKDETLPVVTKEDIANLKVEINLEIESGSNVADYLVEVFGEKVSYRGTPCTFDSMKDVLYLSDPITLDPLYEIDLASL